MNFLINKEIAGLGKKKNKIAKSLGWQPSKISKISSGVYTPTDKEKIQLAKAIGVTVESIFQDQEPVGA